jgi:hypothetical protein
LDEPETDGLDGLAEAVHVLAAHEAGFLGFREARPQLLETREGILHAGSSSQFFALLQKQLGTFGTGLEDLRGE